MNYNEKFTEISYQLADNIRKRKTDDIIRFAYNGVGYDVGDRTARIALIDRITYDYMTEHAAYVQDAIDRWIDKGAKGQRPITPDPDKALIERLTDAILDEELTDGDAHKSAHNEYPILSAIQLARRQFGRRGSGDTNMNGETALESDNDEGDRDKYHSSIGSQMATDGRSYRNPIRRTRRVSELLHIDQNVKIRNKQRAAQYLKDTSPGGVTSYNLRDAGGAFTEDFVQCRSIKYTPFPAHYRQTT